MYDYVECRHNAQCEPQAKPIGYRYRLRVPDYREFEARRASFMMDDLEGVNWNHCDNFICSRGLYNPYSHREQVTARSIVIIHSCQIHVYYVNCTTRLRHRHTSTRTVH